MATWKGGQHRKLAPRYTHYGIDRRKERRLLQSTGDTDGSRFPRGECEFSGAESSQGIPVEILGYPRGISCGYCNAPSQANYVSRGDTERVS